MAPARSHAGGGSRASTATRATHSRMTPSNMVLFQFVAGLDSVQSLGRSSVTTTRGFGNCGRHARWFKRQRRHLAGGAATWLTHGAKRTYAAPRFESAE